MIYGVKLYMWFNVSECCSNKTHITEPRGFFFTCHSTIPAIKIALLMVLSGRVWTGKKNRPRPIILPRPHSALKLEKSAISKVQNNITCIFKNGKKPILAVEKSLKLPKMHFWTFLLCKNCFFLPFLKMQIMYFCTF